MCRICIRVAEDPQTQNNGQLFDLNSVQLFDQNQHGGGGGQNLPPLFNEEDYFMIPQDFSTKSSGYVQKAPPPPLEPPPLMPIFNDYGSQGESSSPGSNSVESTPPRIPDKTLIEENYTTELTPTSGAVELKKRGRGRSRGEGPTLLPCSVCGDMAPAHMHYGGVACFSCRAFFRRSVDKAYLYECQEGVQCEIDVNTRRNCQFCRYQKCLRSGMKASWVLNEDEKRTRIMRKKANNPAKKISTNTTLTIPAELHFGTEQPKFLTSEDVNEAQQTKTISLAPIDHGQMENWLFAIESTRHTVTLPMPLAIDFAHLTSQKLEVLDDTSVMEFFKLFYKRVVKFTSFIREFSSLSTNDRKSLLTHNLEALSIVRLAVCFDPNQARANISQLKEFGRPDVSFGQDKIEIGQIFRGQWAANQKHVDLYCQTVNDVGKLPFFDVQTCLLLQLVALFDTFGLENLENVRMIENQQITFVEMILSYLRTKVGAGRSNTVLQKYLNYLPKLRILCEMITRTRI